MKSMFHDSKIIRVFFLSIGVLLISSCDIPSKQVSPKLGYAPPTNAEGVYLGISLSDIIFEKGGGNGYCSKSNYVPLGTKKGDYKPTNKCRYGDHFASINTQEVVDRIESFGEGLAVPFSTIDDMQRTMGEAEILSVSEDFNWRGYSYVDWGITFYFKSNQLRSSVLKNITWGREIQVYHRRVAGEYTVGDGLNNYRAGDYFINGVKICPSPQCPWENDGKTIKPKYEGKSYRDFISSQKTYPSP